MAAASGTCRCPSGTRLRAAARRLGHRRHRRRCTDAGSRLHGQPGAVVGRRARVLHPGGVRRGPGDPQGPSAGDPDAAVHPLPRPRAVPPQGRPQGVGQPRDRDAELAKAGMATDRQEAAETILALVGALGDYDARTRGHSERTQLFVTMLADELKLSSEDKGKLMWAALVHDIGKLKVPHEVLNKPAKPDRGRVGAAPQPPAPRRGDLRTAARSGSGRGGWRSSSTTRSTTGAATRTHSPAGRSATAPGSSRSPTATRS